MPSERFFRYIEQCKIHHAVSKTFSGRGVLKHIDHLLALAAEYNVRSALDYGCGKGGQYRDTVKSLGMTLEKALGFEVDKYDPAVEMFSAVPQGVFDMVWCTDVLEHIPEEDIDWVVQQLDAYTDKILFVTVGCYPAKKLLPNGENTHITQRPREWWEQKFSAVKRAKVDLLFG